MSGIAGIIRFDGAPVEPGLVEKMTGLMPYRGPDGIHHWVKGSVALGQCMLRTTPESLEEQQPLCNEDESLVLVMDGRVDNWEELRRELLGRGAVLRTRADAELVLRAYEAWDRDCLRHIDGDFALVIWDARRREAFCARDRIGKKTFTYHWDGKRLAFASELHAILALPGMREELNEGMLAEFLAMEWYSRDETFWKGIYRLIAAHRMVVGANGPRIDEYWMPDLWQTLPYTRDEEYVEHYRALLFDVVRRTSRSHLPVAFEVSGGLDSSALFAVAEHLRRDSTLPAPAIEGYTLAFENAPDAEERQYARAVGAHLGVRIHEVPATIEGIDWYRERARHYREFPGYPNGVMGIGLREAVRGNGSRALIAGIGGDEWLGMPWTAAFYSEGFAAWRWRELLSSVLADVRAATSWRAACEVFRWSLAPLLPPTLKRPWRLLRGRSTDRPEVLSTGARAELERRGRAGPNAGRVRPPRGGQKQQLATLWNAYAALARETEERLAANVKVDLRYPLHNKDIIELALTTPERLRSRGGQSKWSHRRALTDVLPRRVLERQDKATFSVTFRWSLDGLLDSVKTHLLPIMDPWLDPAGARSVCERYPADSGNGRAEWFLWSLIGCATLVERPTGDGPDCR